MNDLMDVSCDEWARRPLTPNEQRRRRYRLAQWRSEHANELGVPSAASCMQPSDRGVVVHVGASGTAHTRGVLRCGSVGSCPVCAPVVRAQRADDIEAAIEAWRALGNEVWFVTLTVPHSATDDLGSTLDQLRSMWRSVWSGKGGQDLKSSIGLDGFIRAFEVTYSEANGWHPHLHVAMFTKRRSFRPELVINRWRSRYASVGLEDRWTPGVSCDVRKVTSRNVGAYLGKVRQEWGAGAELARGDLKRGKSLGPQQLLELAATGEVHYLDLWRDWERATKGMRWIEWSRGLRDRASSWQMDLMVTGVELTCALLSVDEDSDQEAAAGEDARDVVASWHVPAPVWRKFRQAGELGLLLAALVANDGARYGCWLVTPWRDPGWKPPIATAAPAPTGYGSLHLGPAPVLVTV